LIIFSLAALTSLIFSPLVSAKEVNEDTLAGEIAQDLEYVFEEASEKIDGKFVLNEQKIIQKFGQQSLSSIAALVKMANGEELTEIDLIGVPNPDTQASVGDVVPFSYKSCMIDAVLDATGISFLTGGMAALIDQKAWVKLGKEIIKFAGKKALMGGVAGFAASMAWYSVRCIGK